MPQSDVDALTRVCPISGRECGRDAPPREAATAIEATPPRSIGDGIAHAAATLGTAFTLSTLLALLFASLWVWVP